MIAVVLVDTTSSTVKAYETHGNTVWGVYTDVNENIEVLDQNECKDNLLRMNAEHVEASGYRSSNCITFYNKNVKKEVDAMADKVNEINLHFGEVALSVYRSYIGVNPMVDGEAIERHINSTYQDVSAQWAAIKPDINTLRITLTNNINALTTSLATCFTGAHDLMNLLSSIVLDQITYCAEYNGNLRFNPAFQKFIKEIEAVKNNYPEFVW